MNILDKIVANKHEEIKNLVVPKAPDPYARDFSALFHQKPFLIAEIKRASPSEGLIAEDFDPVAIAQSYVRGAADAISVLTDENFFQGSFDILKQIREVVDLPLLCKEFIIAEKQIDFARMCGADLCLLIVKILEPERLQALKDHTESLGMKAVIEVQNVEELETALSINPDILLINTRDLTTFEVKPETVFNLINNIPDTTKIIAASGIKTPDDLKSFPGRVDGFLIGTALMRASDKVGFLKQCREKI